MTDKVIMFAIVLFLLLALLGVLYVMFGVVYEITRGRPGLLKKVYHDRAGWHIPETRWGANGVVFMGRCALCGREIMMDSQGNWF